MSVLWVFLHLLILSWEDMKDQMLSFWLLLELLLTGLLTALWNGREIVWFPGLFLLVVGKLSGERIGLGDGWLLLALAAVWNVDGNSVSWSSGRSRLWNFIREKRNSAGAVFYRWLCADSLGDDHMKRQWNRKKGRFVLEASILVPMICILLVYLVYFTLYTHDCAVVTHGILESGVKGIYRDGRSDEVIREQMQEDLSRKLSGRLLWMEDAEVEVRVSPLQAEIKVSGKGRFLPAQIEIKTVEKLYRVRPCKVIRRSRWMIKSGEE